jgi:acetylornithine deacetylase
VCSRLCSVIIEYPSASGSKKTVSFVGSHLDVVRRMSTEACSQWVHHLFRCVACTVFAEKKGWDFDPFKLTVDGDKLQGRGTTDCLGHVALLTDLFTQVLFILVRVVLAARALNQFACVVHASLP